MGIRGSLLAVVKRSFLDFELGATVLPCVSLANWPESLTTPEIKKFLLAHRHCLHALQNQCIGMNEGKGVSPKP